MRDPNYRPANIEFDVASDGTNIPETFGEFESADEAAKFIGSTFIAINNGMTVARHMDIKEKTELRKEYSDVLENLLPAREMELIIATQEHNTAKDHMTDCKEVVNATITQVKSLATEVKRGLVDMSLDPLFTWRIPYRGRYYFYTYMDKQIKLCAIRDIPEYEKGDIWNAMATNDEIIETNFMNGKTEPQAGKKK